MSARFRPAVLGYTELCNFVVCDARLLSCSGAVSEMRALKSRALDLYTYLMFSLGVSHPRRIAPSAFVILTFHRVLPDVLRSRYPIPGLVVTPEELRWIIETLLPFFEIATVSANSSRQRGNAGTKPLLSISFDDGQIDNVEYAAPVLEALRVPATFYLPTDFIGSSRLLWHDEAAFAWQSQQLGHTDRQAVSRQLGLGAPDGDAVDTNLLLSLLKQLPVESRAGVVRWLAEKAKFESPDWARLMDWDDARTLDAAGHEIGSHCQSHELLPQLDSAAQTRELRGSLDAVAASMVGRKRPLSVCYPNGDCSAETLQLAREAGYENGVTTRWGINGPEQDRFGLLRCDMDARRLRNSDGVLSAGRLAVRMLGHQPGLK
jgi:peptidoglycan/xylan/chitin deacetylase (PgdA/CDA1 family)